MDTNIIAAIFGLLGTVLGGIITISFTYINNLYQLKREKEQWIFNQELEKKRNEEEQKWQREKEYRKIVSNCIKYLSLHIADVTIRGNVSLADYYPYLKESVKWATDYSLFIKDNDVDTSNLIEMFLNDPLNILIAGNVLRNVVKFNKKNSR